MRIGPDCMTVKPYTTVALSTAADFIRELEQKRTQAKQNATPLSLNKTPVMRAISPARALPTL